MNGEGEGEEGQHDRGGDESHMEGKWRCEGDRGAVLPCQILGTLSVPYIQGRFVTCTVHISS